MDKKSPPPDLPPSYDGPSDAAQARAPPVVIVQGGKDYQAESGCSVFTPGPKL